MGVIRQFALGASFEAARRGGPLRMTLVVVA